ncbi:MAG: hypothetical protein H0X17_10320, partial [Deltaproteobacteria bacterium]|nr:hypothetical protein [Deltaproteobacteria bacterium]
LAIRVSSLRAPEMIATHVPGLLIAIVVGLVSWPVAELLRGQVHPATTFGVVTLVGIVVAIVGLVGWMRLRTEDGVWLRDELARVVSRRRRGANRASPASRSAP